MSLLDRRIRSLLSVGSTAYLVFLSLRSTSLRSLLLKSFAPRDHPLRFFALLAAIVLNAKSLPFIWHLRLFHVMMQQLYLRRQPLPQDALFRPIITSGTITTLHETDYNFHKSNSTYFSDLDIARAALVTCLLRRGIRQRRQGNPNPSAAEEAFNALVEAAENETVLRTPGAPAVSTTSKRQRHLIALGGVSCSFKREIPPNQPFDIWTRVLSWDKKWIYLVSHVVRHGAVKPDGYALQPWKTDKTISWWQRWTPRAAVGKSAAGASAKALEELQKEKQEKWQQAIYASSVSKYVVKRGRLTIPPELVLARSGLLPQRPDSIESTVLIDGSKYDWTWANVERERERGWQLAQKFAEIDASADEFPLTWTDPQDGGEVAVLGEYWDSFSF